MKSLSYLHQEEATKFPSLSGKSLSGNLLELPSKQISLMLISLRGVGTVRCTLHTLSDLFSSSDSLYISELQEMCEEYRAPFEDQFKGHEGVSIYEVLLVDRLVFRLLQSLIQRNLRKIVPESRQVNTGLVVLLDAFELPAVLITMHRVSLSATLGMEVQKSRS